MTECPNCGWLVIELATCDICKRPSCDFCLLPDAELRICESCFIPSEERAA
jgi:hypothetical protein